MLIINGIHGWNVRQEIRYKEQGEKGGAKWVSQDREPALCSEANVQSSIRLTVCFLTGPVLTGRFILTWQLCAQLSLCPKQIVLLLPPKNNQQTATHFGLHTTLIVKKTKGMTDDIVPTNDV